ncbi:type I restriction enzyme EcoKI subunit R [Roseivivax jejudonensis]|uniref:Type I restriction enzyme EcoKI subunit R n=1 Tax=Roseivivax jejudonensis TaxID=1529041 RepID=A0A1X6Z6Q1_9RHOB|nr:type ISP restriction/modification enzyme [Roseivivax jejudonensis]SLN41768.1 type I restriction enzyme EcoKI subunit R [Roseivivax jejudonensis]
MQLVSLLERYRAAATNEREKGDYFERLVRVFLEYDDTQKQYYSAVVPFAEWAKEQGWSSADTGIDLVATLADGSGYAAIQCKFYAPAHVIQKPDIDSFISAASSDMFTRLIIADTTQRDFGRNTKETLNNLSKDWNRIGINELAASRIDWSRFLRTGTISLAPKKDLKDHQREALKAVTEGLEEADRGKLIMACGTGKTFTGLRIAENIGGAGKLVLFMVPSLALMSQTVREWKNDAQEDFNAFSACSDVRVGRRADADSLDLNVHDLAFPATTDPAKLAQQVGEADPEQMTVVFSTYHSIDVLTKAQRNHDLPEFDLVICDEAHRTTGVTLKDEDDSNFVRIHSNDYVAARKRLYMTATPRIFGDEARRKADDHDAELASMDDEAKFGTDLFHRGFGWAVENDQLTDYKVVVLAVDEGLISKTIQSRLREGAELTLDDATKIIGCYKALTKSDIRADLDFDPKPMKRALAFCQSIAKSRIIEDEFAKVVDEYTGSELIDDARHLSPEVRHVDGSYNASAREEILSWLKADAGDGTCRILTNAKVLSEGVDVPALDAIMFMHPRKSQIDVVQSVGRVMRKDPAGEKKLGYVILPVAIPPDTKPEDALNDNERYKVVWQILNALRAHDERLDARINQADLGEDISDKVAFVRISSESELKDLTAVVDDIATTKTKPEKKGAGIGQEGPEGRDLANPESQSEMVFDEFTRAIMAKIVQKCGTREYWDAWAKDIAKIAQTHITRITTIVGQEGPERTAFLAFLDELQDDLNPEITEAEAIEMLAQHLITRPVFDALFKGSQFTNANPVSRAMETVLGQLHEHNLAKESESLSKFYASVERRAADVVTANGRQELIYKLYDSFFKGAFPVLTQRLGIVYTPVEVVDFIIHSVNDVLKAQFGQTLGSEGVHILDPFTGTGTFITRLLQSGLIAADELARKYREEIHANEIVLLAYYIAAINIETVYHELMQGELSEDASYEPFGGILLTDTFQMYEQERDMVANLLPDNSERRTRQKALDIRVIIGNPPYSAGQGSANDNAANIAYPTLDAAIRDSYAAHSSATLKNALYDSYIRAIRWASDRIGDAGVMAYVTNAGWVDGNATDGLRECLAEEFSDLYVFHLRGNQRTSGELSRKEGGKIFGSGSRAPIAISVFVKNPDATERGRIHFHDIGDYLSQKEKLDIVRHFGSIGGITAKQGWTRIVPDAQNDWLDQADPGFDKFPILGAKRGEDVGLFENYSVGVMTGRDAWAFNTSLEKLENNVQRSIRFFNDEVERLRHFEKEEIDKYISYDDKRISWSREFKKHVARGKQISSKSGRNVKASYRPFTPSWLHFSRDFNEIVGQFDKILPTNETLNRFFMVSGVGSRAGSLPLMLETFPSRDTIEKGQCFPLYLYEETKHEGGLFATPEGETALTRREAITDAGLAHFQAAYPGETITKEDLFYYIYGLLHAPDYRERFKNNLAKALPRIPAVRTFADFAAFRDAGRRLGDLHVNFESVEPYLVTFKEGDHALINEAQDDPVKFYRVKKMKFGGKGKEKDKTTVIYNDNITMQNIPIEAYDYVVNGKPALEWVMERQVVKQDKASGIVNDANDYANETIGDPRYPLDLFRRVITVSLETMKIVGGLPPLDIDADHSPKVLSVEDLKRAITAHWKDRPAATTALKIVEALRANDARASKSWRVSDILEMLGKTELTPDVVAALSILVQSEYAIFRATAEFIDNTAKRHPLSPEDFQRVLEIDTVLHPVTRKEIVRASERVIPYFHLNTEHFGGGVQ